MALFHGRLLVTLSMWIVHFTYCQQSKLGPVENKAVWRACSSNAASYASSSTLAVDSEPKDSAECHQILSSGNEMILCSYSYSETKNTTVWAEVWQD